MRGAAPIIDVLSRVFKIKCAYLAVESYSGKGIEDKTRRINFFERNEFDRSKYGWKSTSV